MKYWYKTLVSLLILIWGCQQIDENIFGTWKVHNKYYKATYKIHPKDGKIKALVLAYDDGTMKFKANEKSQKYLFKNLTFKDSCYIDAISGATAYAKEQKNITITILHPDTLEVTKYIRNHASKELWWRKKE